MIAAPIHQCQWMVYESQRYESYSRSGALQGLRYRTVEYRCGAKPVNTEGRCAIHEAEYQEAERKRQKERAAQEAIYAERRAKEQRWLDLEGEISCLACGVTRVYKRRGESVTSGTYHHRWNTYVCDNCIREADRIERSGIADAHTASQHG